MPSRSVRSVRSARSLALAPAVALALLASFAASSMAAQPRQDSARNAATATGAAKPAPKTAARRATVDTGKPAKPAKPLPVWPVANAPTPLPGSLLPARRIVAYYGNPLSKRMGILGEIPAPDMLARLEREVARWNAADPAHPAQPALHLIVSVAQGAPGKDGTFRQRSVPELIEKVYAWAQSKNAILFLDVQIGKSTLPAELAVLVPFLKRPNVHLGLDPEFAMTKGGDPGKRIGTLDATHVNYAIGMLGDLVTQNRIPPKVLVVHRFTKPMLTNYQNIKLDPRVQVVINMDGWGPPHIKRASYKQYVYPYPVQYTGFKLFYHNDTKAGHALMTPKDVLALNPQPIYIQYQ